MKLLSLREVLCRTHQAAGRTLGARMGQQVQGSTARQAAERTLRKVTAGAGEDGVLAVRQELLSNLERLVAFFSFEIKFSLLKYRIQLFSIFSI